MVNPLDMVTEDQSVDPDADGLRRVVIRTPGAPAPDLGAPTGLSDNKLMQAVAPEQPNELMQGLAALKDYLLNGQFSPGTKIGNRLFGTGGEERQQLWPEKMIRSGVTLPGDVMSGAEPMLPPGLRREDFTDAPTPRSIAGQGNIAPTSAFPTDRLYERAQDVAGMAGGSALVERPGAATLGSGPVRPANMSKESLVPAIKVDGKIHKGLAGHEEHGAIAYDVLGKTFEDAEAAGVDITSGFVDHRGRFLTPAQAGEYASGAPHLLIDEMQNPQSLKLLSRANGFFTADMLRPTLLSDTQQPGAAVAAAASSKGPAPVFYSALEHAATNAAQETMSPQQWLGYLKNQPGVKQEELQWTGIGDWLGQQKGKIKKEDVQQYLDEHKIEIKDVTKSSHATDSSVEEHVGDLIDQFSAEEGRAPTPDEMHNMREMAIEQMQEYGAGSMGTKYSSYQLPGGENYREHLLTIPGDKGALQSLRDQWTKRQGEAFQLRDKIAKWVRDSPPKKDQYGRNTKPLHEDHPEYEKFRRLWDESEQLGAQVEKKEQAGEGTTYQSSHWDEPNVLAHVRTNDRYFDKPSSLFVREIQGESGAPNYLMGKHDSKGKSLHVEEFQSDWHQQGRKQGYKNNKPEGYTARQVGDEMHVFDPEGKHVGTMDPRLGQQGAIDAVIGHQGKSGVPDAPFKTTWPELALKRMIRHAAENGYDRISWTPGEAQAARYDLSHHIDRLAFNPATNKLLAFSKVSGSTPMIEKIVKPDDLASVIGKEAADKLINNPTSKGQEPFHPPGEYHKLNNAGLKIGGEGMREFYDKMLPKMAEKIGKAHGVKVKQTKLAESDPVAFVEPHGNDWLVTGKDGNPIKSFKSKEDAESHAGSINRSNDHLVHYFDIPQSLRDHAVGKGFPLYMSGIPFPLTPVDHDPFKGMQNLSLKDALVGVGLGKDAPEYKERLNSAVSDVLTEIEKEHGSGWLDKLTPEQVGEFQKRVKQHMKEHK